MKLERGTVLLVSLASVEGHEQRGTRPCVLVSDPEVAADQRFPVVCIVPVTTTEGEGALYPRLSAGSGGLRRDSWALVDQVRSIDKRRVRQVYGQIEVHELDAIDEGLRLFLGF